jgi:hypothetical protein
LATPDDGDEDVGRLEVAVDDPARVRGRDAAGDLLQHPRLVFKGTDSSRATSPNGRPSTSSITSRAALALAGVVDGDDVRVGEPAATWASRRNRAACGPAHGRGFPEQLERDRALQLPVPGIVDHGGGALTHELSDLVARKILRDRVGILHGVQGKYIP